MKKRTKPELATEIASRPRGNSTQRDWRSHSSTRSITPPQSTIVSSHSVSHPRTRPLSATPHRPHSSLPVDMNTDGPSLAESHPDIDIGIALFRRTEDGYSYTHWTLVSVERPHSYSSAPVHLYHISNRNASGAKVPWFTDFSSNVTLSLDPTIIGVVHLGTVDMPQVHLDQYITEMGPGPSTYNTRGLGWSNTSFIIRIVETLSDAGILEIPSTIGQFRSIIQEAEARMESMRSWGVDSLPILDMT